MLLQKNTKAPQAAGKIHTDFEKGFIMAEVKLYCVQMLTTKPTRGYISTAETAPLYCVMCRHCVYVYHKTGTIQCMFYCVVLLLVSRPHRSLVTINTAKIASICCCHYYVCVRDTLRMRTVLGLCWSPRAHNFDSSGVRKHNPRFAQLECDPRISAHS